MNVPGSRQVFPPEGSAGPLVTLVTILQGVGTPNFIRALAAIIFWSFLICVVSLFYELWRLKHNWRLGMAAVNAIYVGGNPSLRPR
jgi:hypothetical protein